MEVSPLVLETCGGEVALKVRNGSAPARQVRPPLAVRCMGTTPSAGPFVVSGQDWSRAGEDLGAVALVLDLAKAFGRVSLPVVWAWATHFSCPRKILRVRCGYLEHQKESAVRRMCGGAAPDHHGFLARVEVELLAPTDCVAGCTG